MCMMPVTLRPENRTIWNFFWSMDAMGFDFAAHQFAPLRFSGEYERGRFYECIYLLRNTVEQLRAEAVKNAAVNK